MARSNPQQKYFPLTGGLDLVTPPIKIDPGKLFLTNNYEQGLLGGYTRIQGFERFDGRALASDASYWILNFDAGTAAISEGDTVTGVTSGHTGEALIDAVITSGSYVGNDAAGYLVLTNATGIYQNNENLQVSAVTKSVSNGTATARGASTSTLDDTYLQDAIETQRTKIVVVPGSGNILGINTYKGTRYAFRNNAGGTAAVLHKESTSGWVAVTMSSKISFDAGTTEFTVGDTLTGGTSGDTGTIAAVILLTGAWDGSGTGYIILDSSTGAFQNNEALSDVAGGAATSDGVNAVLVLPADGRYEFKNYNFYGASNLLNMYWCNGVGKAYQFDGTSTIEITTGMTTDTPNHIIAHNNHLFLSFPGGSVQHSSPTDPLSFSAVIGAGELGIGDDITGFQTTVGNRLAIFARNKTKILAGTSVSDWVLANHSEESGAVEWSLQKMGGAIYLDDRGLTGLNAVQDFGDFKDNVLSELVQPYLDSRITSVDSSIRVKDKTQYRLFFNDSTGLFFTFRNNKLIGTTKVDLGMRVLATSSEEDSTGKEVLYFGSTDGYVYKMDSGTSLDGSTLDSFIRLPYHHYGTPYRNKRFLRIVAELDSQDPLTTSLTLFPDFTYADTDTPKASAQDLSVGSGGGLWGLMTWGSFVWGAPLVGEAVAYIDGYGRNMGILISTSSIYQKPHTIHSLTVEYSVKNRRR